MNPKYCASIVYAQKMQQLKFPQTTEFYWFHSTKFGFHLLDKKTIEYYIKEYNIDVDDYQTFAAPHLGEILEWLPESILINRKDGGMAFFHLLITKLETKEDKKLEVKYKHIEAFENHNLSFSDVNYVDTCATMLISLVENKLLDTKSL